LENRYSWTARRALDGRLVYVGGFNLDGVKVGSGLAIPLATLVSLSPAVFEI